MWWLNASLPSAIRTRAATAARMRRQSTFGLSRVSSPWPDKWVRQSISIFKQWIRSSLTWSPGRRSVRRSGGCVHGSVIIINHSNGYTVNFHFTKLDTDDQTALSGLSLEWSKEAKPAELKLLHGNGQQTSRARNQTQGQQGAIQREREGATERGGAAQNFHLKWMW